MSNTHIQFRIPPEVMKEVRSLAKREGVSANEYVRTAFLRAWFGQSSGGLDKNVVKMICRNMCINQRLAVALLDGDMGVLQDAENDTNKILKQLGYEG